MSTHAISVPVAGTHRVELGATHQDTDKATVRLLIDVGERLGLFEVLAAYGPSTTPALASRTGLNESYLRDWLSAMVEAGRILHDEATAVFALP